MTQDLANIEATQRSLDNIKSQIKNLQRTQKQLKLHLKHLEKS